MVLPTLIVKVELPVDAGFGLKVARVSNGRPLMLSVTELDPPLRVRVIVSLAENPRRIVKLVGDAEMVKSGVGTETEKVVECVRFPLFPVMVCVYVPGAAPAATLTVKLDVADEPFGGVTEPGLSEQVSGAEQFVLRATAELNPLSEVTVTVAGEPEFDVPAASVIGDGLSERPKSAGVGTVTEKLVEWVRFPLCPVMV